MSNNQLMFKVGEENKIVVLDKNSYTGSVIGAQIRRTLSLINDIFPQDKSRSYNRYEGGTHANTAIAILGDRGSGKTSCLYSVKKIIETDRKDIRVLEVIDPSFFDKSRNILEIIIGEMFLEYIQKSKESRCAEQEDNLSKLRLSFQKVKLDIQNITNPYSGEDSELEDLESLASSVSLSKHIEELVNNYLTVFGGEYLLIPIDDMDLCVDNLYRMAEDIRKYLCISNVIPVLTCKFEQLRTVIIKEYIRSYQILIRSNISFVGVENMADAYLSKFIPINHRVYMPVLEDYADNPFKIVNERDNCNENEQCVNYESVKAGVLRLIFSKTRFLFFNTKGQISLIVPRSLRDLRNLIQLLYSMQDLSTESESETEKGNKEAFIDYFYNTWTACLDDKGRKFAQSLIDEKEASVINHIVITELGNRFNLSPEKFSKNDSEKAAMNRYIPDWNIIFSPSCRSYNLSIGDVTRVMEYISSTRPDIETRRLLFFIKTVYSIRLYQFYRELNNTEKDTISVGERSELRNGILDNITKLQQLIGGSFFTNSGGDLIRPERNPYRTRDVGLLDGDKVNNLIARVIDADSKASLNISELKLAEFLMLISSHYFSTKSASESREEPLASYRERVDICYSANLQNVKNIYYDVTAPLFNLLDVKSCYGRFGNENGSKIFQIAEKTPESLYNQILGACIYGGNNKVSLLPDIAIRNMEICEDLFQYLRNKRSTDSGTTMKDLMKMFYGTLVKYNKVLYDDKTIKFTPFEKISDLINELHQDELNDYFKTDSSEIETIISKILKAVDTSEFKANTDTKKITFARLLALLPLETINPNEINKIKNQYYAHFCVTSGKKEVFDVYIKNLKQWGGNAN